MIKSLTIQNFQSHKNTEIEFSPGVNAIIGPSDSGKSAILRSLFWLIFNRPLGNDFMSTWADKSSVELDLGDYKILKKKGKENLYVLSGKDIKKPIKFKAFGTKVPEEIQTILNMKDINIQRQMDAPFLFSLSPGEIGRQLNKLVNLEVIDQSQKNISKILRKGEAVFSKNQNVIKEKEEELKQYDWLPKAEARLSNLECTDREIIKLANSADKIEKTIESAKKITTEIMAKKKIAKYEESISHLIALNDEIETETDFYNNLCDEVEKIIQNEKALKQFSSLLSTERYILGLKKIQKSIEDERKQKGKLSEAVNEIIEIEKDLKQLSSLLSKEQEILKLEKIQKSIEDERGQKKHLNEVLNEINNINIKRTKIITEKMDREKRIKEEMPDNCPLCGQEIEATK